MTDNKNLALTNCLLEEMKNRPVRESLETISDLVNETIRLAKKTNIIHVVGSNGKGSLVHYLSRLFRQASLTTVTYTSPHLIHPGERISVNTEHLTPVELEKLLEKISTKVRDTLSPFELLFYSALRKAEEHAPDNLILEAGMGGRWDATSAIPADQTVLTNVELEHTEFLGEELKEIIAEQTAQIPEDSTLFSAPLEDSLEEFLEELVMDKNLAYKKTSVTAPASERLKALAKLVFQYNAPSKMDSNKLEKTNLKSPPGRLERIRRDDLEVVLDVAHTPEAFNNLLQFLEKSDAEDWALIYGSLKGKSYEGIIDRILSSGFFRELTAVKPPGPRGVNPNKLLDGRDPDDNFHSFEGPPREAFEFLRNHQTISRIAIAGSFKLVGYFKKLWN